GRGGGRFLGPPSVVGAVPGRERAVRGRRVAKHPPHRAAVDVLHAVLTTLKREMRCARRHVAEEIQPTSGRLSLRIDALRGRPARRDTAFTIMTAPFTPPAHGESITMGPSGRIVAPDNPILPFVEGDGTGRDIWKASVRVLDAAVAKAYGGKKKIAWYEVLAGEKANQTVNNWLPEETVAAFRKYLVGIKGPLTTPIGGGIRSLNVALRQLLDLYVC